MILDGKQIKKEILNDLQKKVSLLEIKPKLVVIQVGNNEASNVYIKQKQKMCEYIGFNYEHIHFEETTSTSILIDEINKLNNDEKVSGILVQMPLPNHIDASLIQNAVDPLKDVDGLCDINAGKLFHDKEALYPCTPYGIMELLNRYNISVDGKNVVIVGRSNLVGKPLAAMMLNNNATIEICHSKTLDLSSHTKKADILIAAVGRPNLITKEMVKVGAIVIDVGISRQNDILCGDVDFENVKDIASYITPVPGGVGPMTVAMLGVNTLTAYNMQRKDK